MFASAYPPRGLPGCDAAKEAEMKLVTAIVRAEQLDEIIDAVISNNGRGVTVTTVRGFGQQFGELAGRTAVPDAAAGSLPLYRRPVLLTKTRLDILVLDQDAQAMVDAIAKHARTGGIGDGKIWVCDVDSVLRIRTGEQDRDAV
jgi:nitrogen regulatory protein P-II 1